MDSPIAIDPSICSGKPHVRGTRITVELLSCLMAIGWTREEILVVYSYLKPEELNAALACKP